MARQMDIEREREFLEVLGGALELDPAARRAFVEQRCSERPDLGREVLQALAESDALGDFLEEPMAARVLAAATDGEPEPVPLSLPREVGRYTLLELLGKGGMGEVYRAAQREPVEREVALKLISSALVGEAKARFQDEQQALARLDHNHVARLYDSGTTAAGRPFFAMELLDGEAITRYCDRLRLPIVDRAALFLDVCAAIQHAHQKQVLHRDIKPSNVVVVEEDGKPLAKVIDFGIATRLDQDPSEEPRAGVLGTPAYMSPESLSSDGDEVDTRSDVFALGVLLDELLAGPTRHPSAVPGLEVRLPPSERFTALDEETQVAVARCRATSPQRLLRALRRDLDWIVGRATAAARDDRYGSVVELADDLRRALNDEPVSAHPPGWWYRTERFVRRHRGPAAAGAMVLVAVLLGVIGLASGRAEARREAERAKQALAESQEMNRFVNDLFRVSDPGRNLGASITARELLDRGRSQIGERFSDQPLVRIRFLRTLADIYTKLGLYDTADELISEGIALAERFDAPTEEIAAMVHADGVVLIMRDLDAAAETSFRRALELRERDFDLESADPLAAEKLALTIHNLGISVLNQDRYDEAEVLFRRALEIREATLEPDHPHISRSISALGAIHYEQDEYAESEPYFRRALQLREQALGPEHPNVALLHFNLGLIRHQLGQEEEAATEYRKALAIQEKALGPDHPEVSRTLIALAATLRNLERSDEAESMLQRVLAIRRAATGDRSIDTAEALNSLAAFYFRVGRSSEGEEPARESLSIYEEILGEGHRLTSFPMLNLALSRWEAGDLEAAESLMRRAHEIRMSEIGPDHRHVAWTAWALASLLRDQGRHDEAAPLWAKAKRIVDRWFPESDYLAVRLRQDLAALPDAER